MARPCRKRIIRRFPDHWMFSVPDSESHNEEIIMTLDEYETLRLMDYEGMTQEECAESMGVARTTVTAIYDSVRKKLARFIVEGCSLQITGGAYVVDSDMNAEIEEKGEGIMRIAVTYENGEIFRHFGRTESFKLYDVADGEITGTQILDCNGQGHGALAGVLNEAQVDVLICGGIGMGARMALAEAGIELCPGAAGDADEAVKALLAGNLQFDPDETCHHHDHQHEHECGHAHGCGEHNCHE